MKKITNKRPKAEKLASRGIAIPESVLARIDRLALKERRSRNSMIGILLDDASRLREKKAA